MCSYDRVESLQLRLLQYSESTLNEPLSTRTASTMFRSGKVADFGLVMIGAATIAFALLFCISSMSHNNNDDLLAVIQLFRNQMSNSHVHAGLSESFEHVFLSEIYRHLNVNTDHSMDPQHDKLFRHTIIQRCLSVQASLGYKGERGHRNLTAKLAWTVLNLRWTSMTFAVAFNKGSGPGGAGGGESDLGKPGT